MKKLYLLFSLLLLCIVASNFVSSAPPFTTSTTTSGYEIRPPQLEVLKSNQDYDFPIHIFNVTNGVPITSGVSCFMHLYNQQQSNILTLEQDAVNEDTFDYAFHITGGNLTKGSYFANFQCNSSTLGGAVVYQFSVSDNGTVPSTAQSILLGGLLASLVVFMCLTLFGFFSVQNEKAKLFLLALVGLIFIAVNFVCYQFTSIYLPYSFFDTMFYVLWWISMFIEVGYIIYMVVLLYLDIVTQKELTDLMERGVEEY
jgi:hypothetical protein